MVIPATLSGFLLAHGYWALFSLIFLQEIGVPIPIPNEVSLLFVGYLTSIGTFSVFWMFIAAVAADFIGTIALYSIFYFFGGWILKHSPKWVPKEKIKDIEKRIAKKGNWGIFAGRLLPYVRGYTSVAAGLLKIPPKMFISSVIFSAMLWSGGYVIAGRIIGKEWEKLAVNLSPSRLLLLAIGVIIIIFVIIPKTVRYIKGRKKIKK